MGREPEYLCDYCGEEVTPGEDGFDEWYEKTEVRITRHYECNDEIEAKAFASIEVPEGGWPRGSDMDRI